jgi:hypothetical protein
MESFWNSKLFATIVIGAFCMAMLKVLIYFSKKNNPDEWRGYKGAPWFPDDVRDDKDRSQ